MPQWEYTTLVMGTPDNRGRCWVRVSSDPATPGEAVGSTEKPSFSSRLWQGVRLLNSAIDEMDKEGWELVTYSFSGLLFYFYGVATFRRSKE